MRSDPVQIRCLLGRLRAGDVAVDVGSHKGAFTYWMRRAVGPRGAVYAFEPQPESAAYQRRVVRAFGFANVTVEALAVSSRRGSAGFSAIPGGFHPGGRIGPPRPDEGETSHAVATETLDRYFENARRPVSLLKIDAEGHEPEILRGAREILTRDRPLLLFESERWRLPEGTLAPLFDSLGELGYDGRFILGRRLEKLSDFDEATHQRGRLPEVNNFVFSPRESS